MKQTELDALFVLLSKTQTANPHDRVDIPVWLLQAIGKFVSDVIAVKENSDARL